MLSADPVLDVLTLRGRDPDSFLAGAKNPGGPTMLFATLKPKQRNGKPWDKEAIEILGAQWKDVCRK